MVVIPGYPQIVSYASAKAIIQQMEKTICKIKIIRNREFSGTGFFCKIPFPGNKNNMLNVLITNNHIIDNQLLNDPNGEIIISIQAEQEIKKIELKNRMKYTNRVFDITIIEIKDEDKINNFLELDDIIIKDIINDENVSKNTFIEETIYLIQYPEGKLSVSFGIIDKISENEWCEFAHKCSTIRGSAGSPILNARNNKIIGIHKQGSIKRNVNYGSFLNNAIKEFIQQNQNSEILLQQFNKKYKTNIKDLKINKLDLRWKSLGNEGFKDLCKIEFKELKELILNNNNIIDIKALGEVKYKKLEILDLSQNKISDINIFDKVQFKELKQLYLGYNNISDIKVFERVDFDDLETLNLSNNKIDISKNHSTISNLKSKIGDLEI